MCEKSWQQIVACLGVLAAGCAYFPVNVESWPEKRIQSLLYNSKASAIVTNRNTLDNMPWLEASQWNIVNVDDCHIEEQKNDKVPGCWPGSQRQPNDLAYCIFTSGSSGKPKGVAMSHRGVLNTIHAVKDFYSLDKSYTVLGLSPLSFDLSVSDIFTTFEVGGHLVIPPHSCLSPPSPEDIMNYIETNNITHLNTVPGLFGLLVEYAEIGSRHFPDCLRMTWLSGDHIPEILPERTFNVTTANFKLFAMGGATEAGIWSNVVDITNHKAYNGRVPYGRALPGQRMYVLHTEDNLIAAPGVKGMIVITGDSLMLGYYNDESRTKEALRNINGRLCYFTNDEGYTRYRDGEMENMIIGRFKSGCDYVKIRGYRVELQEVEDALNSLSIVSHAKVTNFQNSIAAYAVLKGNSSALLLTESLNHDIWDKLSDILPVYSMPRWLEILQNMPLTVNGKIDVKALPSPSTILTQYPKMEDNNSNQTNTKNLSEYENMVIQAASSIGIDVTHYNDDIFAFGADSILAVRLINKLQIQYGIKIDTAKFFNDGKVGTIAALVEDVLSNQNGARQKVEASNSDIVLMKLSSPTAPSSGQNIRDNIQSVPVFLWPGAGTTVLSLNALANEMHNTGKFADIYGMSDNYLTCLDAEFDFISIEDIATAASKMIILQMSNQHSSLKDILLGGWSFGGLVMFEIGRKLEAHGFNVLSTLMLDSPLGQSSGKEIDSQILSDLCSKMGQDLTERTAFHFKEANELIRKFRPANSKNGPRIIDVRPTNSNVQFLNDNENSALAPEWFSYKINGADHWTLVQEPFVSEITKIVVENVF